MPWLKQLLPIAVALAPTGWMLALGIIMLFSPDTWFRMPHSLAGRGSWKRESTSNLQVRIFGFIVTSSILYCAQRIALHKADPRTASLARTALGATICAAIVGCGFSMLLRPRFWLERFVVEKGPPLDASLMAALAWGIRVLSTIANSCRRLWPLEAHGSNLGQSTKK